MSAYYPLRTSFALLLLFVPLVISRLGFGTKGFWKTYALFGAGFFGTFAIAGWLVTIGMDAVAEHQVLYTLSDFAGISFLFCCCAFCGGAVAEKTAGKMRRF
jgi:hypothetical protein